MAMRGVFWMNRTFIDRLAVGRCACFGAGMLHSVMNIFLGGMGGRDNANCAPDRNHQRRQNPLHMPKRNHHVCCVLPDKF